MVARLLTLVGVIVALVGFILAETGRHDWWIIPLLRGGYLLVALSLVAALLSRRTPSVITVAVLVLVAVAALAFAVVALTKYYSPPSPFPGAGIEAAYNWLEEAEVFVAAALAFGLTVARRANVVAMAVIALSVAGAVGCAIYAITLEANFVVYVWWLVAAIFASIAASFAAMAERGGGPVLSAPVASGPIGGAGSDAGVE